jgi:hypothetical protein
MFDAIEEIFNSSTSGGVDRYDPGDCQDVETSLKRSGSEIVTPEIRLEELE